MSAPLAHGPCQAVGVDAGIQTQVHPCAVQVLTAEPPSGPGISLTVGLQQAQPARPWPCVCPLTVPPSLSFHTREAARALEELHCSLVYYLITSRLPLP